MTIRLLSVSTGKITTDVLRRVIEKSAGTVELALHIGDFDSDIKGSALARMDRRHGSMPHIMRASHYWISALDLIRNEQFMEDMIQFVDHLFRKDELYAYRSHKLRTIYDYLDYYHILYDVLSEHVHAKKVNYVLFFDVPHQAYDTIILHIAKRLNLPCLILRQSAQFDGVFFSMRSVEDNGSFECDIGTAVPYKINPLLGKKLFYMKGIQQGGEQVLGKLTWRALAHVLFFVLLRKPLLLLNLHYLGSLISRAKRVASALPDWRDPFAHYFHENELAYFEHILGYEKTPIDLSEPYVYFPLHRQPEASTSALGGIFSDQALALECLAALIPDNIKIYVKENPRQRSYMRGPMFFHRLNRIKNLRFVPSFTDTHELMMKSQFVATVAGSVGWEALSNGKKALVFGRPWYKSLPGVLQYSPELKYQDILGYSYSIHDLEHSVGQLLSKSHRGVLNRQYAAGVNNFDRALNLENVAECVLDLLLGRKRVVFEVSQTSVQSRNSVTS